MKNNLFYVLALFCLTSCTPGQYRYVNRQLFIKNNSEIISKLPRLSERLAKTTSIEQKEVDLRIQKEMASPINHCENISGETIYTLTGFEYFINYYKEIYDFYNAEVNRLKERCDKNKNIKECKEYNLYLDIRNNAYKKADRCCDVNITRLNKMKQNKQGIPGSAAFSNGLLKLIR